MSSINLLEKRKKKREKNRDMIKIHKDQRAERGEARRQNKEEDICSYVPCRAQPVYRRRGIMRIGNYKKQEQVLKNCSFCLFFGLFCFVLFLFFFFCDFKTNISKTYESNINYHQ